jgi:hypothetical protein
MGLFAGAYWEKRRSEFNIKQHYKVWASFFLQIKILSHFPPLGQVNHNPGRRFAVGWIKVGNKQGTSKSRGK